MNKYQKALDTLVKYAQNNPDVKWVLIHEENLLQELVDREVSQERCRECDECEFLNYNYCHNCGNEFGWVE